MVEMLQHVWHFLPRVWSEVLSFFGTTTAAVVVFVVLLPLFIRIVELFWPKRRGGMLSLKSALKEAVSKKAVTIIVTLAVWLIAFGYFTTMAVYHDHQGLVSEIGRLKVELKTERDKYKSDIISKDKRIIELETKPVTSQHTKTKKEEAAPAKEEARDPDGIYQFGKLVGKVILPYPPDLAKGTISFGQIQNAQDLNVENDFEYRDFMLHLQSYGSFHKANIAGNIMVRYIDVVCKIVARK